MFTEFESCPTAERVIEKYEMYIKDIVDVKEF